MVQTAGFQRPPGEVVGEDGVVEGDGLGDGAQGGLGARVHPQAAEDE